MTDKIIGYDATGYEVLTNAVRDMLNQYPGLAEGQEILFEELKENSGIAFSCDSGALITAERRTVTGKHIQTCQYPFFVVYRVRSTLERQKLWAQTFLDNLGKWLCGEDWKNPIVYPMLADGRKVEYITRMNSYGIEPKENGTQDWLLPVTVVYENQFYRAKRS